MSDTRFIAGCMTGTSLDGIDMAVVRIDGRSLEMTAELCQHLHLSMPDGLRDQLKPLVAGQPAAPVEFLRVARAVGQWHADSLAQLVATLPEQEQPTLVAAHGQTIWHAPRDEASWQLFDPWPITRSLKLPVVYDLRQADLVAGGEGAPITPLSDYVMFRDTESQESRLVVNLGGICNITYLPANGSPLDIQGGDIGVCNILLDGLVQRLFPGMRFDAGGELAENGMPSNPLGQLLTERAIEAATERGGSDAGGWLNQQGSLGREVFTDQWIDQLVRETHDKASPADLLATAAAFVAMNIRWHAHRHDVQRVVLAGGGAHNRALFGAIARACDNLNVSRSNTLGVPIDAREAMAMAVLGALSEDGLPVTLEQVTHAKAPGRAGAWVYP